MLNLARAWLKGYQDREQRCKEDRRLIDREKSMLSTEKVILSIDFFEYAVKPAIERQNQTFSRIFGDEGENISQNIKKMTLRGDITGYMVPFHALSEKAKGLVDERITVEADAIATHSEAQAQKFKEHLLGTLGKGVNVTVIEPSPEEIRALIKEELSHMTTILASSWGDIALSMNLNRDLWGRLGIDRYEADSLKQGEGAQVLQFWKDVNALEDYRDIFPNTPKGKKKREVPRERNWGRAWAPSFGR